MAARRLTALAPLVAAAMLAAGAARVPAGQAPGGAAGFVQALGDEVVAVLRETGDNGARRRAALKVIFLRSFDAEVIGRFVLGLHWRAATADQRARYMAVFPEYVADIYAAQFAAYSGETFAVIREGSLDSGGILVATEIRRPNAPKIDVDFRIKRADGGYKIVDVSVERLSLVVTKRDEFAAFVRRNGLDALIASLERRTESTGR